MIIKQTNLNLVYPRVLDYRKKFVLSEEILSEYFMPPTILPVPEQVQDEVPRIIVQTKNGHSVLNIALSVASLTTNYNGDFSREWNLCRSYLNERCASVYEIINKMTDNNNIFVGLITNVELENLDKTGLEILFHSLFNGNEHKLGNPYDLSCKLTYVYKERYYINITLENMREFSVETSCNGRNYITGEKRHTISASIDINDRYAANMDQKYLSNKCAFDEILEITSNIINNKLLHLVREGEFRYDE